MAHMCKMRLSQFRDHSSRQVMLATLVDMQPHVQQLLPWRVREHYTHHAMGKHSPIVLVHAAARVVLRQERVAPVHTLSRVGPLIPCNNIAAGAASVWEAVGGDGMYSLNIKQQDIQADLVPVVLRK